jgi:hypothetical protein
MTTATFWRFARRLLMSGCLLAVLPRLAFAQEAVVTGTVTDQSGGVLPGVVVRAVNTESGNSFQAVSDTAGTYRLAVRIGSYTVSAELSGFAKVTRSGLELLVGQQAAVNIQMVPAAMQESVTVTEQAPLINTATSALGKAIDKKQMEDLPVNGRNWVDLAMMAPGSRLNASTEEPGTQVGTVGVGTFQLNLDGNRVTQNQTSGFGQPRYSKDSIAEFEFVSGRFDATQGGSMGLQVNAISKSGSNRQAGSFSGYFRDDKFVGKDFVKHTVLPYSDQQLSWTYGGPIVRNRVHYYVNYEYERQPQTTIYSSPYPAFNIDMYGINRENKGGIKLDMELHRQLRLSVSGHGYGRLEPFDPRFTGGASRAPSSATQTKRHSNDYNATLTQVINSKAVNELRIAYLGFFWISDSTIPWANHPYGLAKGTPIYQLRGYTFGPGQQYSREFEDVENYTIKDNFTTSMSILGRHDLKLGGLYTKQQNPVFLCVACQGVYDMTGGAVPSNIQSLFPVWDDISTWNVSALAPITRSYTLGVGNMGGNAPTDSYSAWIQDDWRVTPSLTLNLGLRYDLAVGTYAEKLAIPPFLSSGRPTDKNNVGPRLGAAYSLSDKTVLRGGFGKYFADIGANRAYWTTLASQTVSVQVLNDGRPDFVTNPFKGPNPTYEQAVAQLCFNNNNAPGCLRRRWTSTLAGPENDIPYSWQGSVGFQRQVGRAAAFDADYLFTGQRHLLVGINRNLAYNPATGANYAYTDIAHLPYPEFAEFNQQVNIGKSNYHALQTSFTKRMSHHWQASFTYLFSRQWNLQTAPIFPGCQYVTTLNAARQPVCDQPVVLPPDLAEEWYLSPDQRQRVTANAIWDLGHGTQLSGKFLYGDNGWATPTSGVDVRQTGSTGGTRLLADGSLIPRNSFDIPSIYKVDLRIQHTFGLGRMKVDVMAECFNIFNHTNLVTYTTNKSSASFGKPAGDTNIDYQPRMAQFGFRTTF